MTSGLHRSARFLLPTILLAGAALLVQARNGAEHLPLRVELAAFPGQVGSWAGQDTEIPKYVLDVLGSGEYVSRIYQRAEPAPVDLFVAYFPSQRNGNTVHTPRNCLPGAGWVPTEAGRMWLKRPGGAAVLVNRYVVARGKDRLLVLYWYQAHGRVVASEYWAKFYLVADAIRMGRTDGALIRVITPVDAEESVAIAQERAVEFSQQVFPLLDSYIPR